MRHCTRATRPHWRARRSMASRSCMSTWLRNSTTRCCSSCTSHAGGCGPATMRSKNPSMKEKGDCVAIVPDYPVIPQTDCRTAGIFAARGLVGATPCLLQGLHAGHQPANGAILGLGHVPDLAEGARTGRGLLADHAGELDAGHVAVAQVLDAEQLRLQHHHIGMVGMLADR